MLVDKSQISLITVVCLELEFKTISCCDKRRLSRHFAIVGELKFVDRYSAWMAPFSGQFCGQFTLLRRIVRYIRRKDL